jgi:hypothetical protein
MTTQHYCLEKDECGYHIVGAKGSVALFAGLEEAYEALQNLREHWPLPRMSPQAFRRYRRELAGKSPSVEPSAVPMAEVG